MALRDIDPFVDTPEGRAFFPYHRFAPGYLLAPADEAPLKRFLLKARWGSFGLIVPYLLAQPWVQGFRLGFFLTFVALTSGAWLVAIAVRCRGFARTRSPMPRLDTSRRVAAALSKGFIVFGLLTCLLFTVGSVAMYRLHVGDPAINVVAGILFGGFWLWYCRIALIRWRAKGSP